MDVDLQLTAGHVHGQSSTASGRPTQRSVYSTRYSAIIIKSRRPPAPPRPSAPPTPTSLRLRARARPPRDLLASTFRSKFPTPRAAMPVWLRNVQSLVRLNEHLLKLHSNFLLQAAGAGRFDLSVVCLSEAEVRELNRVYRNVDRPTDVLAFPYHEKVGSRAQINFYVLLVIIIDFTPIYYFSRYLGGLIYINIIIYNGYCGYRLCGSGPFDNH